MTTFIYKIFTLIFILSIHANSQELLCAENKKVQSKSCGLSNNGEISELLFDIADKCEESASEDINNQYEVIGLAGSSKIQKLNESMILGSVNGLQMHIDSYNKILDQIGEKKEPQNSPPNKDAILLEIDGLSKEIEKITSEHTKITDQYLKETDLNSKKLLEIKYHNSMNEYIKINEKKINLETKVGIAKNYYLSKFVVDEKFKPQTVEFLKKTIRQFNQYKENLQKGLNEKKFEDPDLIREYYRANGAKMLENNNLYYSVAIGKAIPCNLTSAELYMIKQYTGSRYREINDALRGGPKSAQYESIKMQADLINKGLDKIASFDGLVKRGAKYLPTDVENAHCVGCIIKYDAFTSTSKSSGFPGKHKFIIRSKSGKHIAPISTHSSEDEVLFKHGTQFKILDVNNKGHEIEYTMEELKE